MKFFRILGYLVRTAMINFRYSWGVQLMSIATLATAFAITGGVWLILTNLQIALYQSKGIQHISAYFKDGTPAKNMEETQKQFCTRSFIQNCRLVPSEEAMRMFVQKNPDLKTAVLALSKSPFPASMEIEIDSHFKEREELKDYVFTLKKNSPIEEVDDGGEWIDRWVSFVRIFDALVWSITLALCGGMVFMVSNTIQLVVYSRKDEVGILSLVGANAWMIRLPFVLEGILQGLIGSSVALLLLAGGHQVIQKYVTPTPGLTWLTHFQFFTHSQEGVFILAGGFLGILGSTLAVGRFARL